MRAIVIGSGVIGLSTAWFLVEKGWKTTVVERNPENSDSCSLGNAGMIVPSHFVPLAAPGMVAEGVRWMFDRRSPFFVRPRFDLDLIGWGLHFLKSANASHVERSGPALVELSVLSKNLFEKWAASGLFESMFFEKKGIALYFKTQKTAEEELHLAEKARSLGLDAVEIRPADFEKMEPALRPDALGGVLYRSDAHLFPQGLASDLKKRLAERGCQFVFEKEIDGFEAEKGSIRAVFAKKARFIADSFFLAGGSWSPVLARKMGLKLPIQAGKGYSITLEKPARTLQTPAILCEARVAMTPMAGRLRVGGTMEIDALENEQKISRPRVEGILAGARSFFPDLEIDLPPTEKIWSGLRPVSPDGLPFIGRARPFSNLFVGAGHAMMGLSLGPATGLALAELASGERPSANLELFETGRFASFF